jgi:hypothetical protein
VTAAALCGAAILLTVACGSRWREVRVKELDVTVEMPGDPSVSQQPDDDPSVCASSLEVHLLVPNVPRFWKTLTNSPSGYWLMACVRPSEGGSSPEGLSAVLRASFGRRKQTVIEETPVPPIGHASSSVEFVTRDAGGLYSRERYYVLGDRLVILGVGIRKAVLRSAAAERFMRSVRVGVPPSAKRP